MPKQGERAGYWSPRPARRVAQCSPVSPTRAWPLLRVRPAPASTRHNRDIASGLHEPAELGVGDRVFVDPYGRRGSPRELGALPVPIVSADGESAALDE